MTHLKTNKIIPRYQLLKCHVILRHSRLPINTLYLLSVNCHHFSSHILECFHIRCFSVRSYRNPRCKRNCLKHKTYTLIYTSWISCKPMEEKVQHSINILCIQKQMLVSKADTYHLSWEVPLKTEISGPDNEPFGRHLFSFLLVFWLFRAIFVLPP